MVDSRYLINFEVSLNFSDVRTVISIDFQVFDWSPQIATIPYVNSIMTINLIHRKSIQKEVYLHQKHTNMVSKLEWMMLNLVFWNLPNLKCSGSRTIRAKNIVLVLYMCSFFFLNLKIEFRICKYILCTIF